jgi:hypothetical protein
LATAKSTFHIAKLQIGRFARSLFVKALLHESYLDSRKKYAFSAKLLAKILATHAKIGYL